MLSTLQISLIVSLFCGQLLQKAPEPRTSPPDPAIEQEEQDYTPVVIQQDSLIETIESPVAEPMGLAVYEGQLWISDMATRKIHEFRLVDRKLVRSIDAPGLMPTGLTVHKGMLIIADRQMDKLHRRRISDDSITGAETLPYYEKWAWGMVSDGKSLWIVDAQDRKIHQIDPDDGTTIRSFAAPGTHPTAIAWDGAFLWVAEHATNTIYRMDPETGWVVSSLPSPGPYPSAMVFFDGTLWIADYQSRRFYRVKLPEKLRVIEDDERRVRATYQVVYRADGTGKVRKLTSFLAVPRELTGQRIITPVRFDPQPTRMVRDRWGQEIAVFELGDLAPGETRTVRWIGDFSLFRVRYQIDPAHLEPLRTDRELSQYLADDKKYNLKHQALTDWMKDLSRAPAHPYRTARLIYEKLVDSIVYERTGGWNNAAAVLARKSGSCSEYTFALVALLRRAGIPARYVGAISERGDAASFDDVFHRWAEMWMPGYGWIPVDANAGTGPDPAVRGQHFGGRSNRHVVTTIGGGASEYLNWTYNHNTRYELEGQATLDEQPIGRYRPLKAKPTSRNILLVEKTADPGPAQAPVCPAVVPQLKPVPDHTRTNSLLWGALFGGLFLLVLGIYIAIRMQNRSR
ncbi:hypothetical protein KJ612_12555 [Myxococcota bacterium]|nr:hypothetical protein [Myxococcota bacterium]